MPITKKINRLWKTISQSQKTDEDSIIASIANHLQFSVCKNSESIKPFDIYYSLGLAMRDRLVERWNNTQQTYDQIDAKRVYYLSLEYLMGRSLQNTLINLGVYENCDRALKKLGLDLRDMEEMEADAGLGNGGLGRLAACFLDSMATLELPAYGYGIRYEYGIFAQSIHNGEQVESPDNWLSHGYPWEIPRRDIKFPVHFYGQVKEVRNEQGHLQKVWETEHQVQAMAYDVPIPGYQTNTVNNLRLWRAVPSKSFDFRLFNQGDYLHALEDKQKSATISTVLYPNDKNFSGKELRLKQQYFFVTASLQDILQGFKKKHSDWNVLPKKVSIQLNDTHPSIAIAELMRILVDLEDLEWDDAWRLTQQVFSYTNHTVLPEALEKWTIELLGNLLPRHLEIIYQINHQFLAEVQQHDPNRPELLAQVSLIEEGWSKQIRMPFLAIVGSHAINGVSAMHTELLKSTIFRDFSEMYPQRFQNKTNGITPRRWLLTCNPELSTLISKTIGNDWITNLDQLKQLIPYANQSRFQNQWQKVKQKKKEQMSAWIWKHHHIEVDPYSMFDVQIKRIHEYKRQLLNLLYVVTLYNRLRRNPDLSIPPRTVIMGGKAAPGYDMAKSIIHLANDIAQVINTDKQIQGKLTLLFLENYNVSLAEKLIPATDISQHISTAGTEASGTGNMKFSLNGSLILGTFDGANLEIAEEVGEENIFLFGNKADDIQRLREQGYRPGVYYENNQELAEVLEMIFNGYFNPKQPRLYHDIYHSLVDHDYYMLLADYQSYVECQQKVDEVYLQPKQWSKMSIFNTANMGIFSSDRTIAEYAKEIWAVKAVPVRAKQQKLR